MAKRLDKIIQSKTAPKSNNVLWDDGENLKINRNGKWESTGSGLNIDPELMDYFINPVVLKDGDRIPEALYDKENDFVKGWKEGRIYPYIKVWMQDHSDYYHVCKDVFCHSGINQMGPHLIIKIDNPDRNLSVGESYILRIKNGICSIGHSTSI